MLEYRRRREEEIKELRNRSGEIWFHDEREVLETVRNIHAYIAGTPRLPVDLVTVEVLGVLDSKMLQSEARRAPARDVYIQLSRVIDTTRSTCMDGKVRGLSREVKEAEDVSDSEERPMTPPSVPPGYISKSSGPSHSHSSPGIRTLVSWPASLNKPRPSIPNVGSQTTFRRHHTQATNRDYRDQPNDSSFGPFQFDMDSPHNVPDPPSPASSYQSSSIITEHRFPLNISAVHRGTNSQPSNNTPRNIMDPVPLTRSRSNQDALTHSHHRQHRSTRGSFNGSLAILRSSELPMPTPSPESNHNGTLFTRKIEQRISTESQAHRPQEDPPPELLLRDGLRWKENRKKRLHDPLHGRENLASLYIRDHVGGSLSRNKNLRVGVADSIFRSL